MHDLLKLDCIFQSTLPREERLSGNLPSDLEQEISIHAPTRGATVTILICGGVYNISIHAPTRGATVIGYITLQLVMYFNPRSHERSDSNIAQKICLFLYNTDNKYIIR